MNDVFSWVDLLKLIVLIISPIFFILVGIVTMMVFYFFQYRFIKKMKIPQSEYEKKKVGFLKKILYQFPKTFIDDLFNRVPDEFREHGLHMWCGEQGSGKTTGIVHMLQTMKVKYPQVKIRTNMHYVHEDGQINHWQELVKNENGIFGQIEVLDEIQTWFSSLQSKNFPPEMITEISQQRKQRKMIVGSAQVFSRIAKPIREQTTFVYCPMTIFGCLTIVRVSKPHFWDDEEQRFKRFIRTYFFIHTKDVRNAFDTYLKIEKYNEEGFKDDKLRVINQ